MMHAQVEFEPFKADKSQGRGPGQASDYTLRAPTLLTVAPMTRRFTKILPPPPPTNLL